MFKQNKQTNGSDENRILGREDIKKREMDTLGWE